MKKQGCLTVIIVICFFLNGCMGSLWTGASLIYDRHSIYKKFDDYSLSMMANDALNQDHLFSRCNCALDIGIFNGDILLAGHVSTEQLKQEAVQRLIKLPYRDFFYYIDINKNNINSNNLNDTWITAKIKSQIIADADISPKDFKIITMDSVVYIMGDVQLVQANKVLAIAQETTGVEKIENLMKYYSLSNSYQKNSAVINY